MINYTVYPYNNKVIAPADLEGVAHLLNSSGSGGLATPDNDSVCTSERINKWSKHKPVRDSAIAPTYDERFFNQAAKTNNELVVYGMFVAQMRNTYSNPDAETVYDIDSFNGNWEYLKPQGGEASPYRLADFQGYYHNAAPMCQSLDMEKGKTMEINIGQKIHQTPVIRFYLEGIHGNQGGIGFSDIAKFEDDEAKLVLCANIYTEDSTTAYVEVINNNIKLYTDNPGDWEPDCDDGADRWKYVDVVLDIPENNNPYSTETNSTGRDYKSKAFVYLTLDYVKCINGQWRSLRKLAIPYDDAHYYYKEIIIVRLVNSLQILCQDVQYGINPTATPASAKILWQDMKYGLEYYSYFRNPFIKFSVEHTTDNGMTFLGTDAASDASRNYYRIVAVSEEGNLVVGTLKNDEKNSIGKKDIIEGDGTGNVTDYVYYEFDNLFPNGADNYIQNGTKRYYADLYLVNGTTSVITIDSLQDKDKIGNFSLKFGKN